MLGQVQCTIMSQGGISAFRHPPTVIGLQNQVLDGRSKAACVFDAGLLVFATGNIIYLVQYPHSPTAVSILGWYISAKKYHTPS